MHTLTTSRAARKGPAPAQPPTVEAILHLALGRHTDASDFASTLALAIEDLVLGGLVPSDHPDLEEVQARLRDVRRELARATALLESALGLEAR